MPDGVYMRSMAADVVAALNETECRYLLRALVRSDLASCQQLLDRRGLEEPHVVANEAWRDALMDALEEELMPAEGEPDDVQTKLMANPARFALKVED